MLFLFVNNFPDMFAGIDLFVKNRYAVCGEVMRMLFRRIAVPEGSAADFAVIVSDDSLAPRYKKGETVYLRRNTELFDGDIGLFETEEGAAFRQFCADSRGTVYLFAVNRERADADCMLSPAAAAELICYGRLEIEPPVPLPNI